MPYSSPWDMDVPVATIRFGIEQYAVRHQIPEQNLILRTWREQDHERLVIELVRKVAYIASEGVLEVKVPATWWQHFKRTLYTHRWWSRLVPDWMVKRWPVRYDVQVYKACAMFPNLPIPADRPEFEIGFFSWKEGRR